MPLSFAGPDTIVGKYFNPETMEFQDTPITVDVPPLPDKTTQEELRFMRLIADACVQWKVARGSGPIYNVSGSASQRMKAQYDKIIDAERIAGMFVPKKRVEELVAYARRHPRAVIYTCEVRRIR